MTYLKEIKIFVGGPSDCDKYKQIVKKVAEETISNAKDLNSRCTLTIATSEDLAYRTSGNPQSQINQEIDQYSILITFFSKRIGSPTQNSDYPSGSVEEIEKFLARFEKGEKVSFHVFFNSAPGNIKSDEIDQFTQLTNYREKIYREKKFFAYEFNEEDIEKKIRDLLFKIIGREKENHNFPEKTPDSPTKQTTSEIITNPTHSKENILTSINLKPFLNSANSQSLLASIESLESFDKVYFQLVLQISMQDIYPDHLIGTHHINLLYKNKEKLNPSPKEELHLFRKLVGSYYDTIPGWYWYAEIKKKSFIKTLTQLVVMEQNSTVRRGAIDFLSLIDTFPNKYSLDRAGQNRRTFIINVLDADEKFLEGSVNYLKKVGEIEDIETIKKKYKNSSIPSKIHTLIAIILSKSKPADAFTYILNNETSSKEILSSLKGKIIEETILQKGLNHGDIHIVKFSLEELINRFNITNDKLKSLLENAKVPIKEICIRELIKRNHSFTVEKIEKLLTQDIYRSLFSELNLPDTQGVIKEVYSSFSDEKLKDIMASTNTHSNIAYEVYFNRHPSLIEKVRSDLKDNFQKIKNTYELVKLFRNEGEINDSIITFVLNQYRIASLKILEKNGNKSDVELARELIKIDDLSIQENSLKIIKLYGDEQDIEQTLNVLKNSHGNLKQIAIETLFSIAPKEKDFIISSIKAYTSYAGHFFKFAIEHTIKLDELNILNFLLDKQEKIRLATIFYLIHTSTPEQLKIWLNAYLEENIYYYDVVCWLDRIVYSIEPFRGKWKEQLTKKVTFTN